MRELDLLALGEVLKEFGVVELEMSTGFEIFVIDFGVFSDFGVVLLALVKDVLLFFGVFIS